MLRTFMPDGDIDITLFTKNPEDTQNWYLKFIEKLNDEVKREKNHFKIKDISFINANVFFIYFY
jgi:hypothetical protein